MTSPSAVSDSPPLNDAVAERRAALLPVVLLLLLTCLAATAGFSYAFSTFFSYDDEGYLAISIRTFLGGKPLYSETYSQYGPAFYLFEYLLAFLPTDTTTHTFSRIHALTCWIGSCTLLAWTVFRLSRSLAAMIVAYVAAFFCLTYLAHEPRHPHAFCALVMSAAIFFFAHADRGKRYLLLSGIATGILIGTKVNLGAYLLIGLTAAILSYQETIRGRRYFQAAVLLLAVVIPVVLIRPGSIGDVKFWTLVTLSSGIAAMAVFVWSASAESAAVRFLLRQPLLPYMAGVVCALIVASLFAISKGTSPQALLYGMVFQHLGFTEVVDFPAGFSPITGLLGLLGVGAAIFAAVRPESRDALRLIAVLMVLLFVGILPAYFLSDTMTNGLWYFLFTPWFWLAVVPSDTAQGGHPGRSALVCAAPLMALGLYPVSGSQLGTSLTLIAVTTALLLESPPTQPGLLPALRRTAFRAAPSLSLLLLLFFVVKSGFQYADGQSLNLYGSRAIRLHPLLCEQLERTAAYVGTQADQFFTVPGMNSFYIWTGKEPPTAANVSAWILLLNDTEQQRIQQKLEAAQRPVIIRNDRTYRLWRSKGRRKTNLESYIDASYHPVVQYGDYVILERNPK
jgi:hypothetical protein